MYGLSLSDPIQSGVWAVPVHRYTHGAVGLNSESGLFHRLNLLHIALGCSWVCATYRIGLGPFHTMNPYSIVHLGTFIIWFVTSVHIARSVDHNFATQHPPSSSPDGGC